MAKLFLLLSALLCITFAFPNKDASDSDLRIVGGQNAKLGQFPWMVSLRDISNTHFCGGSIITAKWILTAGHCTYEVIPGETSAVVGTISVTTGGDFYLVTRFILHEDFSLETAQNDVGLLELASKITFSENVKPIALETEFVDIVDATVSGWGVLAYGGPHPDTLQYIDLKTISVEDCQERMIEQAYPITDKQVCTFTVYGEGVCIDDSGSALVSDGRQIGFVSWGVPCAVGYPDIFVRVSAYVNWINDAIAKEF